MARNILVVEDDRNISDLIRMYLEKEGFEVRSAYDGGKAIEEFEKQAPDLVLLDIMLPEEDGLSILKKLRNNPPTRKLPILMLTAKGSEYDKVIGLDCGADDYVPKPFGMMELIARVKALLRRTERKDPQPEHTIRGLYVCPAKHIVTVDGEPVSLTLKEFEMLCVFLENRNVVLTRDQLLNKVWGYAFDGESRTVDVHIRSLRQKLGEYADVIETVRGIGYKLSEPEGAR